MFLIHLFLGLFTRTYNWIKTVISLPFNSQVELEMSEEKLTTALNELKEAAKHMIKLKKALINYTRRGVGLLNYRTIQDSYLSLEQAKSIVQTRLSDWELVLPENADGETIYPDVDEEGFEFTPFKSEEFMKNTVPVFLDAKIAMAKFVVSLN